MYVTNVQRNLEGSKCNETGEEYYRFFIKDTVHICILLYVSYISKKRWNLGGCMNMQHIRKGYLPTAIGQASKQNITQLNNNNKETLWQ